MLLRPFSTLLVFAALTVAGLGLAPLLSLRFLPTEGAPRLTVRYAWPGASPEALERDVTTPLEGVFDLVRGVRRIRSVSGAGEGSITLDLDRAAKLDYLRFEVAMRIRQLFPRLPAGVAYPRVQVDRPGDADAERPLLIYTLSGADDPSALYAYAREQLSPRLALTAGLLRLETAGGNDLEWRLAYDGARLAALGLGPDDLRRALREWLKRDALGAARDGGHTFYLRLAPGAADWAAVPVARLGERIIRLGDVAEVSLAEQPPRQHLRINGRNSVRLLAFADRGVNTLQVAADLRRQMHTLSNALPPSYQLRLEEDSTDYLRVELRKIRDRTLLSLGILLAFVLLAYRSTRYLLLIVLSLLVNLGLASILYYALGVELHLYALAGVTVSFGLIVDNTIVMAHHLRQHGDRRVFPALLAATLTTLAALVVVFFLPEQWQLNLGEFARVLMINLGVSLVVAWWVVPALMRVLQVGSPEVSGSSLRYDRKSEVERGTAGLSQENSRSGSERKETREQGNTEAMQHGNNETRKHWNTTTLRRLVRIHRAYERFLVLLLRRRKAVLLLVVLAFGLPVFWLPNKIGGWDLYNRTLGGDYYIDHVKPLVNKALGGTLRLFTYYVYEGAAYRQPEETVLYVRGSMPPGATLEQLNDVFRQVENYLAQFPQEIRQYTTQVYDGQNGFMRITFPRGGAPAFPYLLRSRLIAYSLNLGGVKWNIYGVGQGFSNEGGAGPPRFRVQMLGYNKDELARQAERFAEKLLAHPRIQEANTEANIDWWEKDRFEYELELDRPALARQGLSAARLTAALEAFDQETYPDLTPPDGPPLRLVDRARPRNDLWRLRHAQLRLDSSAAVFGDLSRLEKRRVASALHKQDQQHIRIVEFEYTGSARFGSQYLDQVMDQMRREMPLGFIVERLEWSLAREERRLYGLLGLVAGLIFFICAVTFESLRQALAVLLLIPLSHIGIFLTFYWFDLPFDQGGYTSFLLVSGLTVNGLILILNEFNRSRKSKIGKGAAELNRGNSRDQEENREKQKSPGAEQPLRSSINTSAYRSTSTSPAPLRRLLRAYRNKILPILLTVLSTALGLLPFLLAGQREIFWFALAAGAIGGLVFSILVITVVAPLFLMPR